MRRLQHQLRELVPAARLSPPNDLHLTLKFLGDITYEEVPEITRVMRQVAAVHAPISCELTGTGAFPDAYRTRVAWIGLDPVKPIQTLAYALENELEGLRFPRENKEFKPHVTLARFKRPPPSPEFMELLDRYRDSRFGEIDIDELVLTQSEMSKQGPVYTVLASVPLRERETRCIDEEE